MAAPIFPFCPCQGQTEGVVLSLESLRFEDENEYEYEFTGARILRMRSCP